MLPKPHWQPCPAASCYHPEQSPTSQCQSLTLWHTQTQSRSPFSVSSVFPLPTSFSSLHSPIAYPAVSHRFHKNRACTVPRLRFSSLLFPSDTAAFPCCPSSEETQGSKVQPWPQLPRTPNFPGPLQLGINHLPAQPPRQIPSLWINRLHTDLYQKLLSPAQGREQGSFTLVSESNTPVVLALSPWTSARGWTIKSFEGIRQFLPVFLLFHAR